MVEAEPAVVEIERPVVEIERPGPAAEPAEAQVHGA